MIFRKRSMPRMTISRSRGPVLGGVLVALLAGSVLGQEGDPATALFRRPRVMAGQNTFQSYRDTRPLAVSPSEFLSSGFLSDETERSYGTLLGLVTPERLPAQSGRTALQRFTRVALAAPPGTGYGVGDSVLVVERREGPIGYGHLIVPTGVARVVHVDASQTIAEIVAVYGPIRQGQQVAALPHFEDPGRVETRPVPDGIEGQVLMPRENHELRIPQQILYIDLGRSEGIALGDTFEARGTVAAPNESGVRPVDAAMATLKVVHVRDHTAAVKVIRVFAPHLSAGTRVRLVAKLAN
jgi:hypothetical protein